MSRMPIVAGLLLFVTVLPLHSAAVAQSRAATMLKQPDTIRVATFNVSLHRDRAGQLAEDLAGGDPQALKIARVIRIVQPDILLLNEFDFDPSGRAAKLFRTNYLQRPLPDLPPIRYPHAFCEAVNTGVPSGRDLDDDGMPHGPADNFGFGKFPGQYGMLVLSRLPIDAQQTRTFRRLLWKDMPDAKLPTNPQNGRPFYTADATSALRLSSKSHWDLPIRLPSGTTLHLLACHPTPPTFDGPERRNVCRNHDEIRLFADYISPGRSGYIRDDRGRTGGLAADALFVLLGDLNADPLDDSGHPRAIRQLLDHPRVAAEPIPTSSGAVAAATAQAGANSSHRGRARHDTADFHDQRVGNLRVDYVLPSVGLTMTGSGVFWPAPHESHADLADASDHHLVWIDIQIPRQSPAR